jgi:hypothetical protein
MDHLLIRARDGASRISNSLHYRCGSIPNRPCAQRFAEFTICGEGELVKAFLLPGQLPEGQEVQ